MTDRLGRPARMPTGAPVAYQASGYPPPPGYGGGPPGYGAPPPGYGAPPPGYGGPPPGYGAPPPGYGAPPPRRANWALRIVLILLLLVGLGAGGLALAYYGGIVTSEDLMTLIGQGPGYVEVDNMRDTGVSATLTSLSEDDGSTTSTDLATLDIGTFKTDQPGPFRLLLQDENGSSIGQCAMSVGSGDHWQFLVFDSTTLVVKNDERRSDRSALIVATSELCR